MSLSSPFIARPVGTTLLTVAVALAGVVGYQFLPVSPMPQVEFPTISVNASLPGASPETMASSVATPLERQFGRIAGITEMTSTSFLGTTSITLQFDLNRNIDAAARDVQAAINAARGQLPSNLPSNPTYRKVNPADAPILILAITSDNYGTARIYDVASSLVQQKLSQIQGVGQVFVGGGSLPAVRVDVNPTLLNNYGIGPGGRAHRAGRRQRQPPQRRPGRRPSHPRAGRHRSIAQRRAIPPAGGGLPAMAPCSSPMSPPSPTPWKTSAPPACWMEGPRFSSWSSASPAPTSSKRWTACAP